MKKFGQFLYNFFIKYWYLKFLAAVLAALTVFFINV